MAFSDYNFDQTAKSPANKTVEEPLLKNGLLLIPDGGAFYEDHTVVEGFDGTTWHKLAVNIHYAYSPVFYKITEFTGKFAFSYLVLLPTELTFNDYRISTQYVGGYEDLKLQGLLADPNLDKTKYYRLLELQYTYEAQYKNRIPELEGMGNMEVILNLLTGIENKLGVINTHGDPSILTKVQAMEAKISQLENKITTLEGNHP